MRKSRLIEDGSLVALATNINILVQNLQQRECHGPGFTLDPSEDFGRSKVLYA